MEMVVLTGGAGFIGSNILRALNQRGIDDVLVVDNLSRGEKHLNLNGTRFSDFVDKEAYLAKLEAFPAPELIIHQGACTDTTLTDGRHMMANNYEYSKRLLLYALERGTRFIYASSAAVYGDGRRGFREEPECEWPLNPYAFSKWAFDSFVRRVLPGAKSQVVGLRYFNVYGPGEAHKGKMASVIYQFYQQIKKDGKLRLFEGSEAFRRDFVWIGDVVRVNLFFLDNPQRSGIYNVGRGEAESFLRVAQLVARALEGEIEYIPFPEELRGKYQAYTQADLTRLRAAGYRETFVPLERGVEMYLRALGER